MCRRYGTRPAQAPNSNVRNRPSRRPSSDDATVASLRRPMKRNHLELVLDGTTQRRDGFVVCGYFVARPTSRRCGDDREPLRHGDTIAILRLTVVIARECTQCGLEELTDSLL